MIKNLSNLKSQWKFIDKFTADASEICDFDSLYQEHK